MGDGEALAAGRAALAVRDWQTARDRFEAALGERPSADALDGLAEALWWSKDVASALKLRTRAYSAYLKEQRLAEAARTAVWLAREHRSLYRNDPVADGWLSRARRAAARLTDSSAPGWVLLAEAEAAADPAIAVDLAERAVALAQSIRDADLEIAALARLGALQVAAGAVDEGVAHIDEAMTAAVAGEGRDLQSLGEACCVLMEIAALLGDMERVASWGAAVDAFRDAFAYAPLAAYGPLPASDSLSSFCGACCGGIYLVTGRLDAAEAELRAAIAELEASGLQSRCVHPVTQLAELRVLQGRQQAEVLLERYADLPECTRPLAALDLASGDADAAVRRLRAEIARLGDAGVRALPLWTLLVDAHLACGHVGAAGDAARQVEKVAALTRSRRHAAEALFADAKVRAAAGDSQAPALLRQAAQRLSDASLPLAACRARLAFAEAVAHSNAASAISEARGALASFERLGARPDADRAAAFLRELGVRGRTGPKELGLLSQREEEVLRLVAQGLSNREIAERLFISVKTAGHHVSNILSKLAMRSRTEAAAYAAVHLPPERTAK